MWPLISSRLAVNAATGQQGSGLVASRGEDPGWMPALESAASADPRSGRWAGAGKTECGIHV
jgi:hypothetical protein